MAFDVQDFDREVVERSTAIPVLVDFWADWCGPCKVLGPVLEKLEAAAKGAWVLAKLDTEKHRDRAAAEAIRGIPTVKLFVDGAPLAEFSGALPEYAVAQWLTKHLPNPHRAALARAKDLIAQGKSAEARAELEGVLARDPGDAEGRVLLGGLLLDAHPDRAAELVAPIEEHMPEYPAADAIRILARLRTIDPAGLPDDPAREQYRTALAALRRGAHDEAVDAFIDVIRANRAYDDDGARKAVIAIFRHLGDEHEVTRSRRRSFSSALY